MNKKNPSFIRQTSVLTSRYFKIFFNNKKNVLMAALIPLLTMLIVAMVACVDMYVDKDEEYTQLNDGYPLLSWQVEPESEEIEKWEGDVKQAPQMFTTTIDDEEYYVISDIADFVTAMNLGGEWLEKNYCLNNDVDLNGYEWTPVGSSKSSAFKGIFEGNGHTIYGLEIDSEKDNVGFFGYTKGAEIRNLGIDGINVVSDGESTGGLVGYAKNTLIEECYVTNGKIETKSTKAGILAGTLEGDSVIQTCYGIAETISESGRNDCLVGTIKNSKISYSYIAGEINGESLKGIIISEKYENKEIVSIEELKEFASEIGKDGFGFKTDKAKAERSSTQIGLFMLICVAIFVGICNSIQEIIKERSILKREYMSNLRLGAYVASKLIVQGVICAVQSLLITIIFYIAISGRIYPTEGVVFGLCQIDFYITIFLVTFAADVTALFISSIVKSSVMANTFIPIILIVQIIFSGVLFELGKSGDIFANLMLSKWGVSALAAISRLNESRPQLLIDNPQYEQQLGEDLLKIKTNYASTVENVVVIWLVLVAFIVVFALASRISLVKIKNDKR